MASETRTKPRVYISEELLHLTESQTDEKGQVTLHLSTQSNSVRIQPNVILEDPKIGHISKLVHVENVSIAPEFLKVQAPHHFKLVFEGLPKESQSFNMIETEESHFRSFRIYDIMRNDIDVYHEKV